MSVHFISEVLRNPDAYPYSGGKLVVLLILADAMNHEGTCWPGVDRIAAQARCERTTVFRALAQFEADGIIVREKDGRRNWYRWVAGCNRLQDATGGAGATPIGGASATPYREPSKESSVHASPDKPTRARREAKPDPKVLREAKPPKTLAQSQRDKALAAQAAGADKQGTAIPARTQGRKSAAERLADHEAEVLRQLGVNQ